MIVLLLHKLYKLSNLSSDITKLKRAPILQHVDSPTRARGADTPHILDLVITNEPFVENIDYLAPLGKSDHSVLIVTCDLQGHRNVVSSSKLNLSKGNYEDLRTFLDIDWDSVISSTHENVEELCRAAEIND